MYVDSPHKQWRLAQKLPSPSRHLRLRVPREFGHPMLGYGRIEADIIRRRFSCELRPEGVPSTARAEPPDSFVQRVAQDTPQASRPPFIAAYDGPPRCFPAAAIHGAAH